MLNFRNPDPIYRGTDFWMLNDRLTEEGIRAQVAEMKKQGVYCFIARTYIGLKSDYPGKDFHDKMHIIVDAAREHGMKVFIQAGYMPEAVLGLPDDCALRYIYPVKEGGEDGRPLFCTHNGTSYVEHNSHTFLNMFNKEAVDYYLLKSYEEMWADFEDEYGKTIVSVWVDEPSYDGRFLPWTPDLDKIILAKTGYDIREKLWMLYEDDDAGEHRRVRYLYWTTMRDLLGESYFAGVRRWCSQKGLWFSGHLMMEETLTSQICRACATMPYYKYFDIPGIDMLRGTMRWNDSPIQPTDDTELRYNLYTTALQCTSAAHQAGKEHILAEMYGVISENMGFRNQLYVFDEYAAMGINHRSVHAMFYSLGGRGKRAYPPHVNYYQPYWEKYHHITDYCARVSTFISQGKQASDILIVHPMETGYLLYRGSMGQNYGHALEQAHSYDRHLYMMLHRLVSGHLSPELGDQSTLAEDMTAAVNGSLCVGEMSYGTVILPDLRVLSSAVYEKLKAFAIGGGRLIVYGDLPSMLDERDVPELGDSLLALPGAVHCSDLTELTALLEKNARYRLEGDGSAAVLVNHRTDGEKEHFFLVNNDCRHTAKLTLTVPGKRTVKRCDAFDGSVTEIPASCREKDGKDETAVCLTIPFGASVLVTAERTETLPAVSVRAHSAPTVVLPLTDGAPWRAVPDGDNTLLLEYCRYRKGDGAWSDRLPIMAVHTLLTAEEYRGEITLEYRFRASEAVAGLSLALEHPEEHRIYLNGREQKGKADGYFFAREFASVRLDDGLVPGENILTVTRHFEPLSKATSHITSLFETQLGAELEPMYLNGPFTVRACEEASYNGCVVLAPSFTLSPLGDTVSAGAELTSGGFPFYAGKMTLHKTFSVTDEELSYGTPSFILGVMNAGCASLRVNGREIGDICRAPAVLPLHNVLHAGENDAELTLYGTLHNIIGPFHRPQGDIGNTFGGGYANPNLPWLSVDITVPGWEKNMTYNYPKWTDNYNVTPFGADDASIIFGKSQE